MGMIILNVVCAAILIALVIRNSRKKALAAKEKASQDNKEDISS